jgi:hypothetical protein
VLRGLIAYVPDGTSGYGGIRAGLLHGPGCGSVALIASVLRLLRFAVTPDAVGQGAKGKNQMQDLTADKI